MGQGSGMATRAREQEASTVASLALGGDDNPSVLGAFATDSDDDLSDADDQMGGPF